MQGTIDTSRLQGATLVDESGDKIGSIDEVYLDDQTNEPEFALVKSGFFGTGSHFVPLQNAEMTGSDVRVPYAKDKVKDAPGMDADDHLSQEQEARIYSYYGLSYGEQRSDSGLPEGGTGYTGTETTGTVGRDVSGPTTDDAMTRSEEELRVGTTQREIGKARLRKWIDTEHVSTTVPVEREQVRVEREPITDANVDRATDGPELSEEEHEVTLRAQEPVVEKTVTPKERVRLDKDVIADQRQVDETVRKERIDVDGDDAGRLG